MNQSATIAEAIKRESGRTTYPDNFSTLPGVPVGRYNDPAFFDLEMQHMWRRTWLHTGHVSELAEPGAYKLFEELGQSVIVSRGLNGEIRAFHNVCRHRGSALLLEPKGVARRFLCPYHSWNYGIDGSLLAVPRQEDFGCIKKSELGLMPVRCEIMRGMIFINLDDDAIPLAESLASIERNIGEFPLQDTVVKDILRIELDCNWKTAYDNFLEIYHVSTVHPTTLSPYLDSKSFSISLYKHGHARFATRKKGAETLFGETLASADVALPDASPQLFKEHTIGLPIFPNLFTALDPVGFSWITWWPAGIGKTDMVISLMGWKGDSEEDKAFWAGMKAQSYKITGEDQRLFATIQRSMNSGALRSVLMSYQERALYWYHEEIDRMIGPENIPPQLRITPLLSEYAES